MKIYSQSMQALFVSSGGEEKTKCGLEERNLSTPHKSGRAEWCSTWRDAGNASWQEAYCARTRYVAPIYCMVDTCCCADMECARLIISYFPFFFLRISHVKYFSLFLNLGKVTLLIHVWLVTWPIPRSKATCSIPYFFPF